MSDEYFPEKTLFNAGLGELLPVEEPVEPENTNPWLAFIEKYKHDPVLFCRDNFELELFDWQAQAMNLCLREDPVRRLSICSGHGVGKTALVAMLAVIKLVTCYPVKVICTAPSAATLESNLLPEIKIWINKLPDFIKSNFDVKSDKIVLKADPDAAFIQARTSSADRPEALAGIHSDNVLIIVDEASGVPENVFEVAAGSMSSEGAQTVLISNPTRLSGLFYHSQHSMKKSPTNPKGVWDTIHVSCLDVPSSQVTENFLHEMREMHGEDSDQYRIRVLGKFASSEDSTLIAADLVESAMERDIEPNPMEPLVYGVDPARYGDDRSVLCKRRGNVVEDFKVWRKLSTMELAGHIANEAKQDKPAEIMVDSIGLGAGVSDRLRELGFNARDCNVAESPAFNPNVALVRDELWVAVRDWLKERACKLFKSDELREELVAPTYTFTSSGKLKVESKEGMKKRLRRSPDLADALCLTFASTVARMGGRYAKWIPGEPLRRNIPQLSSMRRRF